MPISKTQQSEQLRRLEIADEIAKIQTDQAEIDLQIEYEKLAQKQEKLTGAKLSTETEKQRNIVAAYGLDKARIDSDIAALGVQDAAIKLGIASDNILALEARRRVNQQTLMNQHRLLELQSHELASELEQKTGLSESLLGLLPSFDGLSLGSGET